MPSTLRNVAKKLSLAVLYRSPPLPQRVHGKMIWVHPRARFSVSTKTFFQGERHVRKWLTEQLKPGDVFFDVGAHHGWVSMWALPLVGKEGAVFSFEPSPPNLAILNWHRDRNRFASWTIVPRAVSDEVSAVTRFTLIDSGDSPMNSLTTAASGTPLMEGRDIGNIAVQTTTLDSFCEAGLRPDLVKIDVEGAELLVLRGARRVLNQDCPVIILAVHPYWLPAGQSPAQIMDLLEGVGYSVFDAQGGPVETLRSGEYLCLKRMRDARRHSFIY